MPGFGPTSPGLTAMFLLRTILVAILVLWWAIEDSNLATSADETDRISNHSKAYKLVDAVGVEPTMPCGRRIYSPLGLPIFLHIQNTSYRTHSVLFKSELGMMKLILHYFPKTWKSYGESNPALQDENLLT